MEKPNPMEGLSLEQQLQLKIFQGEIDGASRSELGEMLMKVLILNYRQLNAFKEMLGKKIEVEGIPGFCEMG